MLRCGPLPENTMSLTRPLWLSLLLLCTATAVAAPDGSGERALLAADSARTAAMVAQDYAALDRALGEDLTYGHSTGQVQGKQEFIADLRNGVRRYRAVTAVESAARAYGCAGIVTGTSTVEVESQGHALSFTLRYTATYARQHDRWVLVAYQSVRLP
jgi:hypothetical protein